MGKRKKRILFDVMGEGRQKKITGADLYRPAKRSAKPAAKARPAAAAAAEASEGEIRLTYSMAATFAFVFLVVVVLAYYFGHQQGAHASDEPGANRGNGPSLSRGASTETAGRGEFSIRARSVPYVSFMLEELIKEFQENKRLLEDEGFDDIFGAKQEEEDGSGRGTLTLWVGRAEKREDLDALAAKVRGLTDRRGDRPFESAYVLRGRPSR